MIFYNGWLAGRHYKEYLKRRVRGNATLCSDYWLPQKTVVAKCSRAVKFSISRSFIPGACSSFGLTFPSGGRESRRNELHLKNNCWLPMRNYRKKSVPGLPGTVFVLLCILWTGPVVYAQGYGAEKRVIANSGIYDTGTIKTLCNRAGQLIKINPDSARALYRLGIAQSLACGYGAGYAWHLLGLGKLTAVQGRPGEALSILRKAQAPCVKSKNPRLLANYYLNSAYVYDLIGYRDSAISHAYKILDICNQHPGADSAQALSAQAYSQLGRTYMIRSENPLLAISFFSQALEIAERNHDPSLLTLLYTGIGGCWVNQNLSDSSSTDGYRKGLQFYARAAQTAKALNDDMDLAGVYINISGTYCNLGMLDSAAYYVNKVLSMPGERLNYNAKIKAQMVLAALFYKEKNYGRAIQHCRQAAALARKYNAKGHWLQAEYYLFQACRALGDHKQALLHLEQYARLRDSLLDEEKIKATRQLETKYRVAQKDKELARKDLHLMRQKSELKEKNIWIGAGGLSSLFLVGLLLVWRRNSQHRRRLQEKQIRFMEQEQALWKQGESIRNLNAMIRGEEKERARLGRELHDGIVSELVAIKMNFDTLQLKYPLAEAEPEFEKALQHLDDTARELRKTAQNLMPDMLMEHGLTISLAAYCEKTSALTGLNIRFVCEDYLPRLPLDFELSLYRMIQELVQNILKHAQASVALVQLNYHSQLLLLTVEDNGKGIDTKQAERTGIGLSNLKSRVEALQGRFEVNGRRNKGTYIYVEFDVPLIQSSISDEDKNSDSGRPRTDHRRFG